MLACIVYTTLTAPRYASAVYATALRLLCMFVRLSQVGVLSKRLNESSSFLVWGFSSTYPTLCYHAVETRRCWMQITLHVGRLYSANSTTSIRSGFVVPTATGVDGSCTKHLTVESYMVIYASNSDTYYY